MTSTHVSTMPPAFAATVAVIGLGYVGLPLLVAAGSEGFELIAVDVDVDASKVRSLRNHRSYLDGEAVADGCSLVFDAAGITRTLRAPSVVRL